jgi:hypothetical protein
MQFAEFISQLQDSKQQAIVWHNQTTSFSEHKALNNYYDEILENIDGLLESVAGIYGRPINYSVETLQNYTGHQQVVNYFKALYDFVQRERKTIYQETWIQNQVDEVAQLIAQTLYLLSLS